VVTGRALLVINPASRQGGRQRTGVEREFRSAGVRFDVAMTRGPGDATAIVRGADPGYDAIFALGGDGTAIEAVSGCVGTGRAVGILPAGTGNLLAGALGIPRGASRAARVLLRGGVRRVDLARLADGRYFAFAAGMGIDVAMLRDTNAAWKRRLGIFAYVVAAGRAAWRLDDFALAARVDGCEVDLRASLVMVANFGSLFGGRFQIGPDIEADDGMLDLCVFSPKTALDVLHVIWRVWRRDFRPNPRMRFVKGKRIRLASTPSQLVEADGELLGLAPIEIEVAPLAAMLLVPGR
jgi:diacylglycerol kinase (ATP)